MPSRMILRHLFKNHILSGKIVVCDLVLSGNYCEHYPARKLTIYSLSVTVWVMYPCTNHNY